MSDPSNDSDYLEQKQSMIRAIVAHGAASGLQTGRPQISEKVLEAMRTVPRHSFVPSHFKADAYTDGPLPIGYGKTVSQPFIVALMTDLLDLHEDDRVLEIGTGLGYQAAVLSRLCSVVYTVDIIDELTQKAETILSSIGYNNVHAKNGNGMLGWEDNSPYDKILVAACGDEIPPALVKQLKPDGRLIMPVGDGENQNLVLLQKGAYSTHTDNILPVRFSRLSRI